MSLTAYREGEGKTLDQAARELGLTDKGYLSRIERRERNCPLGLALRIHRWSAAAVPATELVTTDEAELLRYFAQSQRTMASA